MNSADNDSETQGHLSYTQGDDGYTPSNTDLLPKTDWTKQAPLKTAQKTNPATHVQAKVCLHVLAHLPLPPLGTQEGRTQRIQALAPGQPARGHLRFNDRSSKR